MKSVGLRITGAALVALFALAPLDALGQCCGDCNGDGAVTVDEILATVNRALATCVDDRICDAHVCPGPALPASGQTTPYGPGSDGAVRAGTPLAYRDNGDGTVTDLSTGLMWEKKDQRAGGIHNWENTYTWGLADSPYTMNGTMVTEFLAALNQAPCFAGHCDWRIPNANELRSITDYQNVDPAVDTPFNTNCAADCTVDGAGGTTPCSCTQSYYYWTSTTYQDTPSSAWHVYFYDGVAYYDDKSEPLYIRGVRGGL